MPASLPELEVRVRALEAKSARTEEDIDAHSDVLIETRDLVREIDARTKRTDQRAERTERLVAAIVAHLGIDIPE